MRGALDKEFGLERLDPSDARWLGFISGEPSANIFHHPRWISVLDQSYASKSFVLAAIRRNGGIAAGVPITEKRGLSLGARWVSLPFSDCCRPLSDRVEALGYLTSEILREARQRRLTRLDLRWDYGSDPMLQRVSSFVLSTLRLDPDPGEVAKRIKPKHFRQIDVAYGRGVEIRWGTRVEDLRAFYDLQCQTRRRFGLPVQPWRFFLNLFIEIIREGHGFLLLARRGQTCLAGAVFLHWNKTLVYKYSASCQEAGKYLAMDPILWTAITWGCENGLHWLDMGRTESENHGLRNFKKRWGAEEQPLVYSKFPARDKESPGARWMPMLSSVIRNSPVALCKILGELFYRFAD